jgi:hypothetical protein
MEETNLQVAAIFITNKWEKTFENVDSLFFVIFFLNFTKNASHITKLNYFSFKVTFFSSIIIGSQIKPYGSVSFNAH